MAPSSANHLTTKQWVIDNTGSPIWLAPVISSTTVAQPGHVAGARYILTTTPTGAQWAGHTLGTLAIDDGATWTFVTPTQGSVTRVLDTNIFVRYKTGTGWSDISTEIDHNTSKNLQGGTSSEYYHLTAAQHAAFGGSQTQHYVYAAPLNSSGTPSFRGLDTADILTGVLSPAHGGFGTSTAAVTGYSKWTGGVASFSATIPYSDLSSVPSTFTPSAHASSHGSAGSDPLALDASQITTGALGVARGGTGSNGSAITAKYFLASPTGATGAVSFRALLPDDIAGASAAYQLLRRNSTNTANEWVDYTLAWPGLGVNQDGVLVGTRRAINFTGVTVTDDSINDWVRIDVPVISMDPIVAAIVFGE